MGKVEDALRDLIKYHSRREARELFGDTEEDVRELKRDLRQVRRVVEDLEEKVDELYEAHQQRMDIPPADEEKTEQARVTSRTLQSIRDRFDLTQDQLADLLDVSSGSITSWENGNTKPRSNNKARIVTLREMEKEEVDEIMGREDQIASFDPDELRDFREEHQITQNELGGLLDVSETTVYKWEQGETKPGKERLEQFRELSELDENDIHRRLARFTDRYSGEHIRELRENLELSQSEFAERTGVSPATVSNWETGTNSPGPDALRKIRELQSS